MDGNARWATENNLSKAEGHKKGAQNATNIISLALKLNIPYLTLYAFSAENWQRKEEEVFNIVELFSQCLQDNEYSLIKNNIKLRIIGRISRLDLAVQERIDKIINSTNNNNGMTLCIAFGYGSRQEIVDVCQKAIDSGIKHIDEKTFKHYMYDPEMPDVDLLIRTSGVLRISNFLLWQAAYAELYFCKKNWPDFSEKNLISAIDSYNKRKRTFGTRIQD
ncbi:MAG: di-trans,poly-cis-decaprenylcistransferase [Rickettsiaceae bacterium]|nr:MAG: di-trans,poly-cis-decaprenylcistransferase [Rickettsiaceae bacterium]